MRIVTLFLALAVFMTGVVAPSGEEIFYAVKDKNLELVKGMIDKNASLVKLKDEAGNTPLHHAAMIGSRDIIEYLLSRGADINAQNTQLNTPLHEAMQNQKEDVGMLLIDKGTDLNKTNIFQQTPLHRAASLDQKRIGEMLIAGGVDIDPLDRWQRTPFLLVARQTGNVKFGKLLLDNGANINSKDRDNQMALNLAAWKGYNDFIDFLLDNGAEYYSSAQENRWMLISSVRCGSARLFKVVLDKQPELLSDESFGKSIMHDAIKGGSIEIVNLLLSKHIPLNNDANRYGWTLSHYAASNGHAAMIRFLFKKNFDINQRTRSGKTVYNIAEDYNQSDVLKAIKELNGDTSPGKFPRITGIYIGQAPPAGKPELFAPDIVSGADEDDNHGSIAFMPDGREIYWNMKGKIWVTKLLNGKWIKPEIASFCEEGPHMDDNPFITTDGKKMFFTSTRPGSVSEKKENIWYAERTSSGWSDPIPVSSTVNAMPLHWGISVSDSGTLYFGGTGADNFGRTDIYYSRPLKGIYSKPINIGAEINSQGTDHCPYIAPDESYIIYSRWDRTGRGFYISYRSKEGKWLEPVRIHEHLEGVCPLVSPDGNYFFFNSDGIYWMPAAFIKELKPKN